MIRLSTIVWIALIAGTSGYLFQTSYEVQSLEDELANINRRIVEEQRNIRVLRAEWAYLNHPDRLRTLSQSYAPIDPVKPGQILASLEDLPMRLPEPALPDRDGVPLAGLDDGVLLAGLGQIEPTLVAVPGLGQVMTPRRRPGATVASTATGAPTSGIGAPQAPARQAPAPQLPEGDDIGLLLARFGTEEAGAGLSQ